MMDILTASGRTIYVLYCSAKRYGSGQDEGYGNVAG